MAEVSSEADGGRVDSDALEKTGYVFRGPKDSLRSAEAFLRNRGWTLDSGLDLRAGLAECLRTRPRYVVMCADQMNPTSMAIARMIESAIGARLILFCESNPTALSSVAKEVGCAYLLFPPVSGPAIERMAWRILRDERKRAEANQSVTGRSQPGGSPDSAVVISSEAQAELMRLIQLGGAAPAPESVRRRGPREPARAPVFEQEPESPEHNAKMAGPDVAPIARARSKNPVSDPGGWSRLSDSDDLILVTGTERSLRESASARSPGESSDEPVEKIESVTRLGCIEIQTERYDGYLLIAWGADRSVDEPLMRTIRAKLVQFMQGAGQKFDAEDAIRLRLQDVTFEGWAVAQADFLRRAVHAGREVAVAFFPGRAEESRVEASARADMVHIGIDEIKGDSRVEFDVYVHLPANGKYLLYTPEGGRLYQVQKDRLKAKGVRRVHLKKNAAPDLRRYRVQNFLNDRIAEARAQVSNAA